MESSYSSSTLSAKFEINFFSLLSLKYCYLSYQQEDRGGAAGIMNKEEIYKQGRDTVTSTFTCPLIYQEEQEVTILYCTQVMTVVVYV